MAPVPEKRASKGPVRSAASAEAILDAAAEILAESGPAGLRMEAVARRARAGKATLYRWWPTRGALLLAVYERSRQPYAYPETDDPLADIRQILSTVLRRWQSDGETFRAIIAEAQSDPDVRKALVTFRDNRIEALATHLARAKARGLCRADLPERGVAEAMVGLLWLRLLTGDDSTDVTGFTALIAP